MQSNDSLIKYFFILGLSKTEKEKLKETKNDPKTLEKSIEILSSYSVEGETLNYNLLKENLRKTNSIFCSGEEFSDPYLRSNIFPIKANYLDDIDFESMDENNTLGNGYRIDMFKDYFYETDKFNERPNHFFHCFQNQLNDEENPEKIILYNYGVLIFYENVIDERDLNEEKEKYEQSFFSSIVGNYSTQYNNIFVAKALILISETPIFSLMKEILENIYDNFIQKRYISFPLEPLIINCLNNINNNLKEITFSNNNEKKIYKFHKQPILPFCDLNLLFFFKIFSLKDIFLLGEFYLLSKKIIILSSNLDYLYPIYHILMTLFHPLNIYVQAKFYKLLTPDKIYFFLFEANIPFIFIYTEEDYDLKNDLINKELNKLRESNNDIELLIYEINDNSENEEVDVKRHIFYKNENVEINEINRISLIEKILSVNYQINYQNKIEIVNYQYLIGSLNAEILKLLKKYENNYINNFYDFSIDYNEYEKIRELFFGIMIKFIVLPIKPIQFEILNDKTLQIKTLEIKENIFDGNDRESIDDFISTEQSDILYKNGIVQKKIKDESNIKKKILLDYYIKISFADFKRQFFQLTQQKNIVGEGKNNNGKKLIDNKNFNDFFVVDNKNYFYYYNRIYLHKLRFPQKDSNFITYDNCFIKYLNVFQDFADFDKSEEIKVLKDKQNHGHLEFGIYFGEDFNLFFDQFIYYKYKISKKNNNENLRASTLLKNTNFINYYKLILDEAEIFHDLFITQSLIIDSRKALAACAVGLYISIYLINLLSEEHHTKKNILIESNLKKLYKLFEKTKCFYGKFDFLITLLYLIIISHVKDREKYLPIFFNKLLENKITPSIIIILMNNEGHQYFDFEYLRKIHKNNKKKQKKNLLCKSHIFNNRNPPTKNLAISNIDVKIKDLANEEENIKEIIITKIAQIKHKHDFESDDIYGDYHCKDNVCSEYMSFYIDSNILNKECDKYENIINPKYIINDLFTKILEENNLFIFPNDKMIDDIKQIAMYDQLYFHIGYFRNDGN